MKVNYFELARTGPKEREKLCRRTGVDLKQLMVRVAPILEEVRKRGDDAVIEFTARFDGAEMRPENFRVSADEMDGAVQSLPSDLKEAMEVSIANIRRFHERQVEPRSWEMEISPGITAGERIVPIPSVGLYVPRGKGSFPSMMMMSGVPAKVAGVERIAVMTPPDRNGKADPATVAAARMIGIQEVYALGGAQAVAALAYGTETIPRVDKIVGPGSGYVLAAKQILSTEIDTGLPAGPSEAIILADDSADPLTAVTDLLIEAEHGPDSSAYLVTTDADLASQALDLIPRMVAALPEERASFCTEVFKTNGGVILATDMNDAVDFINQFAPEHLQILTREPLAILDKVKFAGEALLGPFTPGTLANYSIGPNAILPTSGFARTASALSVRDFTRRMSYSIVTEEGFAELAPKTLALARYEGFAAHAGALSLRLGAGARPKKF
ncbi:MAG: histidinol dehydrogenase [Desulfomonile tiedjei]|uniref:Histidinol dehydrogenase n=1 Tax=Desulfomonile tiedjei TaxID=2358 RepID=A0A9D6Z048_9BACT|nr:histidinol dehydrogenase [Desulfomonile tiedjei]